MRQHEIEQLARLAAAACDDYDNKSGNFRNGVDFKSLLMSFSEPEEVLALGKRAWAEIEKNGGFGLIVEPNVEGEIDDKSANEKVGACGNCGSLSPWRCGCNAVCAACGDVFSVHHIVSKDEHEFCSLECADTPPEDWVKYAGA